MKHYIFFQKPESPPAGPTWQELSYSNEGGSGDRTSIITVNVDEYPTAFWRGFGVSSLTRQELVDGNTADQSTYIEDSVPVADRWMEFDFLGVIKRISEVKFYVNTAFADCGVWKWQGYGGAEWEDIGDSFTFGVDGVSGLVQTITTLEGNVNGYYKYRMIGVSGDSSFSLYYWTEFEFKIAGLV